MNLLTQLLLHDAPGFIPPPPVKSPRRKKAGRPMSAIDIYRPYMRNRGTLTGAEIAQFSGRSPQAVYNAMIKTLAPRGVVRVVETRNGGRMSRTYEWIGK